MKTETTFSCHAGMASCYVDAASPDLAAEIAEPELREILSFHLDPEDESYPREMIVNFDADGITRTTDVFPFPSVTQFGTPE